MVRSGQNFGHVNIAQEARFDFLWSSLTSGHVSRLSSASSVTVRVNIDVGLRLLKLVF
jgi:hypothetical protein